MSLFGAMATAISGLTAQSAAFGNIGDNVANSQTVGFKRVDTSFEDYLTTSTTVSNESGAVVARPDYANSVQGTVTQTDKPLDLAISGQGFFSVSHEINSATTAPAFSPEIQYTRTGDFSLDRNGYMVNSAGGVLNGWLADSKGVLDTTKLAPIQVGESGYRPIATSQASIIANLPATPASSAPIVSPIQVYDALGQVQTLQLSWTKSATASTWQVSIAQPGAAQPIGTANVAFGAAGNAGAPEGTVGAIAATGGAVTGSSFTAGGAATLQLTTDFGSGPQAITLNLGTFGQGNGLTQYAGTDYSLKSITQDGVAPGSFSSVSTQANGDVVVNFDNGQTRTIAQVPLTLFASPDSLKRQDGQAFTATRGSGPPQVVGSGSNGSGTLVVRSVESSNVDIASEFSKLIVAQRAYSANTKLVTTADEMLQQTLDMKR